jgi:hypothetical protein
MYTELPEWYGQKHFIIMLREHAWNSMSSKQNWEILLKVQPMWLSILIVMLYWCFPGYKVCYWFIFIFYYHCNFMCSWNIDCQCTLYYAMKGSYICIYRCFTKEFQIWNLNIYWIREENTWHANGNVIFYSNPHIQNLWLFTTWDM